MSAYIQRVIADTEDDLEQLINKTIKELGYMRQPGVIKKGPFDPENEQSQWFADIKYWGLD